MGLLCSRLSPDHNPDASRRHSSGPANTMYSRAAVSDRHAADIAAAEKIVDVLNDEIASLDKDAAPPRNYTLPKAPTLVDYFALRQQLAEDEKRLGFEHACRSVANPLELRADAIVQALKKRDCADVYDCANPREGYRGQLHPRFPGDHFLSNVPLIDKTALLDVARKMPKGAHLHIHFNACLLPHVLLDIAKGMERMFITSDLPLVPDNDYVNFDKCEIQFSILSPQKEAPGDLFSHDYKPRQTMRFRHFLELFPQRYPKSVSPEHWLMDKLVFQEKEAHDVLQTASGYVSMLLLTCFLFSY